MIPLARHRRQDEEEDSDEEFFGFAPIEAEEVPLGNVPKADKWKVICESYDHLGWLQGFQKEHGPTFDGHDMDPFEVFSHIITPDVYELLVEQTNLFADQFLEDHPRDTLGDYAIMKNWKAVDLQEMRAFVGILYYFGLVKMPSYKSYWTREPVMELKGFRTIMPRWRWEQIWKSLHLNNKRLEPKPGSANFNQLYKVQPLMELLLNNWQENYYPGQEVSVDESIIAFKGRVKMKVYMPQKPHKWGIKAWALCESQTGYLYNWDIYRGAGDTTEVGLTKKVVLQMAQPIAHNRHHIYMDNFFSSPELFNELADLELGACGTLRVNRRGVPDSVKKCKKMSRGDPPKIVRDGNMTYICWEDKKTVNLLTNLHNGKTLVKKVRCKDPANNNMREIIKPLAIEVYNQFMGGVDLMDQKLVTYLNIHRQVKWWRKVFVYLLEASMVNTRIIFQSFHPHHDVVLSAEKFRTQIINRLVAPQCIDRALGQSHPIDPPMDDPEQPLRFRKVPVHYVGSNPNRTPSGHRAKPDCVVCSNRKVPRGRHQVTTICKICRVPMCPFPCFERYHELELFRVECSPELHQ
jgi:hypothetical protein